MASEIRKNEGKNRLYVRLIGLSEDEEVRQTSDSVIRVMGEMKPGFTVVIDISDFRPMTQASVDHVRRVAAAGVRLKMRATARIVGKSQVVAHQFQRVSREAGYPSFTTTSLEEADKALDDELGETS